MICVECGKESEIINNGLCSKCYIKSKRFTHGPELFEIIKCSNCSSYKFKNKWENKSLEQIIYKLIYKNFKINNELIKPEIKIISKIPMSLMNNITVIVIKRLPMNAPKLPIDVIPPDVPLETGFQFMIFFGAFFEKTPISVAQVSALAAVIDPTNI